MEEISSRRSASVCMLNELLGIGRQPILVSREVPLVLNERPELVGLFTIGYSIYICIYYIEG